MKYDISGKTRGYNYYIFTVNYKISKYSGITNYMVHWDVDCILMTCISLSSQISKFLFINSYQQYHNMSVRMLSLKKNVYLEEKSNLKTSYEKTMCAYSSKI